MCQSTSLSRRRLLKTAAVAAGGSSLAAALAKKPGIAQAHEHQPQEYATRMAPLIASEQVSLEPGDMADVTIDVLAGTDVAIAAW